MIATQAGIEQKGVSKDVIPSVVAFDVLYVLVQYKRQFDLVICPTVSERQFDPGIGANDARGRFQEVSFIFDGELFLTRDVLVSNCFLDVVLVIERGRDDLAGPLNRRFEVYLIDIVVRFFTFIFGGVIAPRMYSISGSRVSMSRRHIRLIISLPSSVSSPSWFSLNQTNHI